jgi:hypothetical protein
MPFQLGFRKTSSMLYSGVGNFCVMRLQLPILRNSITLSQAYYMPAVAIFGYSENILRRVHKSRKLFIV